MQSLLEQADAMEPLDTAGTAAPALAVQEVQLMRGSREA